MASELEHMLAAESLARKNLGKNFLPVVPLFETAESLAEGPRVVTAMIKHPRLGKLIKSDWGGQMEIMVGYSDSSKQAGVWPSRLAIATAMHALERTCTKLGVKPIFFQGSGGSVDRGGGSVQDQVAWWPRSALTTYKVTIQGEMVERSLANPEITRGQLLRIAASAARALEQKPKAPHSRALTLLSDKIKAAYRERIHDKEFLALVGAATPYANLSTLKIGSRPTRRTREITVDGLRAIPWVLCWTQTRVLFQTWWGVGRAWKSFSPAQRKALRTAFTNEPVFASYVKALGFTLAKVEMPIWETYVRQSGLDPRKQEEHLAAFRTELAGALAMVRYISGSKNLLWFKPWLGESIRLRAPMIHPLNLLQLLAIQSNDHALFRTTATGISSGMMTTG
jgi:phosphoenolpyruvate carboxylase